MTWRPLTDSLWVGGADVRHGKIYASASRSYQGEIVRHDVLAELNAVRTRRHQVEEFAELSQLADDVHP